MTYSVSNAMSDQFGIRGEICYSFLTQDLLPIINKVASPPKPIHGKRFLSFNVHSMSLPFWHATHLGHSFTSNRLYEKLVQFWNQILKCRWITQEKKLIECASTFKQCFKHSWNSLYGRSHAFFITSYTKYDFGRWVTTWWCWPSQIILEVDIEVSLVKVLD